MRRRLARLHARLVCRLRGHVPGPERSFDLRARGHAGATKVTVARCGRCTAPLQVKSTAGVYPLERSLA